MVRRVVHLPVYRCKVVVIFDHDINEASRAVFKKHKIPDDGQVVYGCVIYPPENIHTYYLLYGTDYLTLNLFVHELTHLTASILKHRGHTDPGDEPAAYLSGYLAGEVEKIMIRNGIEFIKPKLKPNDRKQPEGPTEGRPG